MASVRRPKGTRPGVSEQTSPRGVLDLQSSFASSTSDGGSVFGPPFTFGKALAFNRHPPDYLREFPQIDHPSPLGSTWPAKLHSSKTFTATAKHSGKRSSSPSALSTHTGKVRTNELESCSTTRRRHAATKSRPHSDLENAELDEVPGPGYYNILPALAKQQQGPAFTMGSRPLVKAPVNDTAEPLASAETTHSPGRPSTTGGFTMGARPRHTFAKGCDTPGPGAYNKAAGTSPQGPAYTFPISRTLLTGGYYAVEVPAAQGPAFSMGARHALGEAQGASSPGPAAPYQRIAYEPTGPAFSILGRIEAPGTPKQSVPGPGAYQPTPTKCGPAYTIAGRALESKPAAGVPGVGAYDVAVESKAPAFTIAGRPTDAAEEAASDAPGPGDYSIEKQAWRDGPAFTISQASGKAVSKLVDTPGPAHYAEPSAPATTPAFTIGIRREEVAAESDAPAVGTYNPNKAVALQSTPAFTIGRSARQQAAAQDVPGPGEYDGQAALPEGQAYTIPKARRPQLATAELDAPAPGDYHTDNTLGEAAPAFTIAPRIAASSKAQDGPSPADYMPHPLPTGPAFTAAGRTALPSDKVELGPGPAEYDTAKYGRQEGDYHAASSLPTGPAYSLPTAKRALASHADAGNTPAPGDYHVDFVSRPAAETHKQANPLASKPRAPKHAEDTPGPTDFDPQLPKSSAPAYTMGKRTKAMLSGDKENARIGPEYDLPGTGRGAAFTMAGKPMEPHEEPTPGPGHFYEMKSFPQPLGKVVSILKRHDSDVQITKWKHVTFSPSAAARLADN
ncbi:hypothetical protein WJX72_003649 [[Myrmecia] bisecta]|uniref:Uncharacterized protein n=1 Tax=[Myrmecia] bisecta TaxID=41462 RepID=A0AAW1PG04_9CHLO